MKFNIQQMKEEYHVKLLKEGYSVLEQLPFDDVNGKFALYALNKKSGREKLIQIKDFSDARNFEPLMKTLESLAGAKIRIELETLGRRNGTPSALELELIGLNVKPAINNEFCTNIVKEATSIEYKRGLLHARVATPIHKPTNTRRFIFA